MSAVQVALGWAYGILIVGYFVGLTVSGWRLRELRAPWAWNLETLALLALVVGWPTGRRVQAQLRRHERPLSELVTPQTRPLLVAFAVLFVPFMALTLGPTGEWKQWVTTPLGLTGLVVACSVWRRHLRPEPHPA